MKYQVCDPLTSEEYTQLKADIAKRGIQVPVELDENGDVLDGHHRIKARNELISEGYAIPDYPVIIRTGMSESEKMAHAWGLNALRRQMTPERRKEIILAMLHNGASMEDAAKATGISRKQAERYTKEARDEQKQERNERILELHSQGLTQREIAEEVGVTHVTVGNVASGKKSTYVDFLPEAQNDWIHGDDADYAEELADLGIVPELTQRLAEEGRDVFVCSDCQDIFDNEVWHCPDCNHHWPMSRDVCHNCYAAPKATIFAANEKERRQTQDAFAKINTPVSGTFTASGLHREARKQMQERRMQEAPSVPSNKYRVIYADPPWQYGNVMPDYATEQADHYHLLTVAEVAALPIVDMAEDNAVLFLWVTSPILEESFQVINAWGFQYKASFVWDKVKHNMGHYNSVRHELLLICTRGSCQPDVKKLFDSVQSIERTEHSVKPDEFRQIIDTIYPYGGRVELFARRTVDGWDSWGNEI